uniref:Uncharacterized protein n=1 Tax=Leersia perrieri TaxID=77586 RepID=A0A0D9WTH9_9ORYZ
MQIEDGICPVKVLLLALRATIFFIASHCLDENCPVNKLLEIFKTWRGKPSLEDCSSGREPSRRLKLTSRTLMLLENNNSIGRLPSSKLLSCNSPVRLPSNGEMRPWSPLEAKETSVTVPSLLQLMPSHLQQSVPFTHDMLRLPLRPGKRPSRKPMRELSSCSVQQVVRETKGSRRTTTPNKDTDNLVVVMVLLLHGKLSSCMRKGRRRPCVKGTSAQRFERFYKALLLVAGVCVFLIGGKWSFKIMVRLGGGVGGYSLLGPRRLLLELRML